MSHFRVGCSSTFPGAYRALAPVLFPLALAVPVFCTELKPETARAFQHYAEVTEAQLRGDGPQQFLYFDGFPEPSKQALLQRLHDGQVIVAPRHTRDDSKPMEIPSGLVHHWVAVAFFPGVTLQQALALAQDYPRETTIYAPDVQQARVLAHDGSHYDVYLRFYRQAIVTVIYNTEFAIDYVQTDATHAYTVARSTRVAEVTHPGKPDEKEMPVGNDDGYLWRLNLYTRYLQADDGVYIQVEFLALSRRVPVIFAWLVNPYVRSIPREYLTHFLQATRKALTEPAPTPPTTAAN